MCGSRFSPLLKHSLSRCPHLNIFIIIDSLFLRVLLCLFYMTAQAVYMKSIKPYRNCFCQVLESRWHPTHQGSTGDMSCCSSSSSKPQSMPHSENPHKRTSRLRTFRVKFGQKDTTYIKIYSE